MKLLAKALVFLLPLLVAFVYMSSNDSNYTGLITLCLLLCAQFLAFVMDKPLACLLFMMVSLHWFQMNGMAITLYFIPVAVIAFLLYNLNRRELRFDGTMAMMTALILGHMGFVILVKPFPIEYIFFYINSVCFLFFIGSSMIRWDARKVQTLLNAHLVFMIVWGFIERALVGDERIIGPALSSTNYAVMLVVEWTIWLINGYLVLKYKTMTLAIVTFLVLLVVLFSGTRMGMIGMALCGVLTIVSRLFLKFEKQVIKFLFYFIISSIGLCALAFVVWQLLPDSLFLKQGMSTFLSGKIDLSSLGRIGAWYTAFNIIQTDPVWGVGPGNFLVRNTLLLNNLSYVLPIGEYIPRLGHAHNVFLLVLSEQGLVGFAVLGSFCLTGLYFLIRFIRCTKSGFGLALLSGGVVTLFLGMFDVFPLFPSSVVFGSWYMSVLFSLRDKRVLDSVEASVDSPASVEVAKEIATPESGVSEIAATENSATVREDEK